MGETPTTDRYANTGFSIKDTSPEVNEMIYKHIMSLTGEERLVMGFSMLATARQLILSSLPKNLTEKERKLALFERLYGYPFPAPHLL